MPPTHLCVNKKTFLAASGSQACNLTMLFSGVGQASSSYVRGKFKGGIAEAILVLVLMDEAAEQNVEGIKEASPSAFQSDCMCFLEADEHINKLKGAFGDRHQVPE